MEFIESIIGSDSGEILWWQMGIRGAFIFLLAIVIVRYLDRRIFGKNSAFDIVLGIILGSILSRAITGNASFWATIFTSLVLVGLHWLFAFLAYRFDGFGHYVKGWQNQLIKDGKLVKSNMRRFNITRNDIEEACRQSNLGGLEKVKEAYLERSGNISLITFKEDN